MAAMTAGLVSTFASAVPDTSVDTSMDIRVDTAEPVSTFVAAVPDTSLGKVDTGAANVFTMALSSATLLLFKSISRCER